MRGILINNAVHTGNDLGLVMTSKSLPAPTVQKEIVLIPGRNGSLDMSETLTGEPTYNNRPLTFAFFANGSREEVLALIDALLLYHGQYITLSVDDLEDWYYEGRAEISYVDHHYYVEFELAVDAQPFRQAVNMRRYAMTNISSKTIVLENMGVRVLPTVTVSADTTIKIGTNSYTLGAGTYEDDKLLLATGANSWVVTTTGTITITYREAKI